MIKSSIKTLGGLPYVAAQDELIPACAYITYFEENNDYKSFASHGYRLFSVAVTLSNQAINTTSGFLSHRGGIFDVKGKPDFSFVDESVRLIVQACPDALIFPRIHVTMPDWWLEDHPTETVPVSYGKKREALYSTVFRDDATEMLLQLIRYFQTFPYAEHIVGYQISGGNTQEWFHLDLNGSLHENALPYFNDYLKKKGLSPARILPDMEETKNNCHLTDPMQREYIRFANDSVSDLVEHLCKAVKEAIDFQQIVGLFYGYTMEVSHKPLWGSHSLTRLLDCPYVDFFSSPCSYADKRALGVDWPDMIPVSSLDLHGKACFIECDVRTYLTKGPNEYRPSCDPHHIYTSAVWAGPPTEALSVSAVRKSFARQLTCGHGLWWFDMFGHWYDSESLMQEMHRSFEIYREAKMHASPDFPREVAVFLDENTYSTIGGAHPAFMSVRDMRVTLGEAGAPYSVFLICDFERINWEESPYKAVLFLIPGSSPAAEQAKKVLQTRGFPFLSISEDKTVYTAKELRSFYRENGVFIYGEDVIYAGNGFAALHATSAGIRTLHLPKVFRCTDTLTGKEYVTDRLSLPYDQYETKLFRVENT